MQGIRRVRYLPEGELRLTPENRAAFRSRESIEEAARRGTILESMCLLCDCATMQLTVEMPEGMRGIIPRAEAGFVPPGLGSGEVKDIAVITRVGKPVQYRILSIREDGRGERVAVCSRRAAQEVCWQNAVSRLLPGEIIPARITHLEPFGAFCDIGCGLVSLLTVDRISVSRISHPADRFRQGERIRAVVSSIEDNGRIFLSHRELLGTWEENAALFSAGQTVSGIIRSVETYGVFVELAPNLAGLAESTDGAIPGHTCSVYIKSILPERMKVKLVLIDVGEEAGAAPFRYFIDPDEVPRLTRWRYSPEGCRKVVESVFEEGTDGNEQRKVNS
ncbi:MAG: S1 RNA-binding domain-containing protein [Clostridiales bacterium]|nr:S1 RNA-binding domain-containing protein [Clostridiales bacterium]